MAGEVGGAPVRVLVCDDALGFPALVASWLDAAADVEHVGTTTTATELLDVVAARAPDVVLLDVMLPEGQTSSELVQQVRDSVPGVRVILVSSLPTAQLEKEVRRTGADAGCPKATTAERLHAIVTGRP